MIIVPASLTAVTDVPGPRSGATARAARTRGASGLVDAVEAGGAVGLGGGWLVRESHPTRPPAATSATMVVEAAPRRTPTRTRPPRTAGRPRWPKPVARNIS